MQYFDTTQMFTVKFDLWPFHLDLNRNYPLSQIVSRMIHTAGEHADTYGFGIQDLNEKGCTWVLHRLSLNLNAPLSVATPLYISTTVLDYEGLVTRRIFILTQEGRVVGTGMTHWVALSLELRRPVPLATLFPKRLSLDLSPDLSYPLPPKQVLSSEVRPLLQHAYDHRVRYSDLDLNAHVNSAVWVNIAMNAIKVAHHGVVKSADMHFMQEALADSQLQVWHAEQGLQDMMSVRFDDGREAFTLSVQWADK